MPIEMLGITKKKLKEEIFDTGVHDYKKQQQNFLLIQYDNDKKKRKFKMFCMVMVFQYIPNEIV